MSSFSFLWYNYMCIGVRNLEKGEMMGKKMVLKCE